ncbi:hypothetical protein BH23CYA1_BH23CYA1_00090 [soil metagenome]
MTQRKPIIAARRTDHLEALLQKLWTLRPVYKDKQAFTIAAGVAALIREIEQTDLMTRRGGSPSIDLLAVEADSGVASQKPAAEEMKAPEADDEVWD